MCLAVVGKGEFSTAETMSPRPPAITGAEQYPRDRLHKKPLRLPYHFRAVSLIAGRRIVLALVGEKDGESAGSKMPRTAD